MALKNRLRRKAWHKRFRVIKLLISITIIVFIASMSFRFDLSFGSDRITPISINSDIFGNYIVKFATDDPYNIRSDDGFYYIDKNQRWIADTINNAISQHNDIDVYYDIYVGYEGFTAPKTSPIIMAIPIDDDHKIKVNTYKRGDDDTEYYLNLWWRIRSYYWQVYNDFMS